MTLLSTHRKLAVVADVTSNILTASRGMLAILIPGILLGFLWSGGSLNCAEYTLWVLILLICVHDVYANGPAQLFKHDRVRDIVFTLEWVVFLGGGALNFLGAVRSPDLTMLGALLALSTVMHIARRGLMHSRCGPQPPK